MKRGKYFSKKKKEKGRFLNINYKIDLKEELGISSDSEEELRKD
jgi:hypothetical protein